MTLLAPNRREAPDVALVVHRAHGYVAPDRGRQRDALLTARGGGLRHVPDLGGRVEVRRRDRVVRSDDLVVIGRAADEVVTRSGKGELAGSGAEPGCLPRRHRIAPVP